MNIHPSFTKAFFQPESSSNLALAQSQQLPRKPPVLFSKEKYGGMPQFMAHPDFKTLQKEYAALADGIVDVIRKNADKIVPPLANETIESTQSDFNELKNHLADDFFSTHKEMLYGHVKEKFHQLENLLGNEKIPLQNRMNAVVAMAPHMRACSGGVNTALDKTICSLNSSTAGIKGQAYHFKIQMIDALVTSVSIQY